MSFLPRLFNFLASKPVALRNDPVLIIGVHRSGTSALGGALQSLGLSVGKTVMPPSPDNPLGYYENNVITDLHDQFLAEIGESWSSPHPIHRRHFSGKIAEKYQLRLRRLLGEEFGQERALIKDPRLCQLLPLWAPFLQSDFSKASFVLPVRHPLEVAASMRKRDKFTTGHGLALWTASALEGERATRNSPRFFTTYEQLLAEPVQTVDALARELGLPSSKAAQAVSKQIDPTLRHHVNPTWPADEPHRDMILDIYETLVRHDDKMQARLDDLREKYYRETGVEY